MLRARFLLSLLSTLFVIPVYQAQDSGAGIPRVESPSGDLAVMLLSQGGLRYVVEFHGKRVFDESALGIKLEGQPPLGPGMHQVHVEAGHVDETYTIPVGKTSRVRDHYNSARADFEDAEGRKLSVEVRAYDDGIAFRIIVPEQPPLKQVRLEHELTEFRFSKDAITYPLLLDGFQTPYEDEYTMRQVSGLHKDWLVGLPFLAHVPGVAWVGITEANIDNYAGMYLRKGDAPFAVRAELSARVDHPSFAVEAGASVTTPWRGLLSGDEPGRLVESNLILNLNPPSKIADTSWIRAGK